MQLLFHWLKERLKHQACHSVSLASPVYLALWSNPISVSNGTSLHEQILNTQPEFQGVIILMIGSQDVLFLFSIQLWYSTRNSIGVILKTGSSSENNEHRQSWHFLLGSIHDFSWKFPSIKTWFEGLPMSRNLHHRGLQMLFFRFQPSKMKSNTAMSTLRSSTIMAMDNSSCLAGFPMKSHQSRWKRNLQGSSICYDWLPERTRSPQEDIRDVCWRAAAWGVSHPKITKKSYELLAKKHKEHDASKIYPLAI